MQQMLQTILAQTTQFRDKYQEDNDITAEDIQRESRNQYNQLQAGEQP